MWNTNDGFLSGRLDKDYLIQKHKKRMSLNPFFSYVHPSLKQIYVPSLPEHIKTFYLEKKPRFLHEIVYASDLPKCLELEDAHDANPYHLLFYMLARFYFFDDGQSDIQYYYAKRDRYLVEDALALLPPRFKRSVEKDEKKEYCGLPFCKWMTDFVDEPWAYSYVKNLYSHIWSPISRQKGKRIFISRETCQKRQLPLDSSFVQKLLELGFSIYNLDQMTMKDQIELFRSAEFITGPHGAGFTWITFCQEGTLVYEICPPEPGKGHYADICQKTKLLYGRYTACTLEGPEEKFVINYDMYIAHLRTLIKEFST